MTEDPFMEATIVRRCAAASCAWNEDGTCHAKEISIQVNRRGGMSCWNYTDAREERAENGKEE